MNWIDDAKKKLIDEEGFAKNENAADGDKAMMEAIENNTKKKIEN